MPNPNDQNKPTDSDPPADPDPRKQVKPGEVAPEVPPSPGMDNPVRQPSQPAPTPPPEQK